MKKYINTLVLTIAIIIVGSVDIAAADVAELNPGPAITMLDNGDAVTAENGVVSINGEEMTSYEISDYIDASFPDYSVTEKDTLAQDICGGSYVLPHNRVFCEDHAVESTRVPDLGPAITMLNNGDYATAYNGIVSINGVEMTSYEISDYIDIAFSELNISEKEALAEYIGGGGYVLLCDRVFCVDHELETIEASDIGPAIYVDSLGRTVSVDSFGHETVISEPTLNAEHPEFADTQGSASSITAIQEENLIVDMFGNVFTLEPDGNETLLFAIPDDTKPVWVTPDGAMTTLDDEGNSLILTYVDVANFPISTEDTCSFEIPALSMAADSSVTDVDSAYLVADKLVLSSSGCITGLCNLSLFVESGTGICAMTAENSSVVIRTQSTCDSGRFPCLVTEDGPVVTITIG